MMTSKLLSVIPPIDASATNSIHTTHTCHKHAACHKHAQQNKPAVMHIICWKLTISPSIVDNYVNDRTERLV